MEFSTHRDDLGPGAGPADGWQGPGGGVPGGTEDIIAAPFESAPAAVQAKIEQVLDAVTAEDFDRLASYHLTGPKFTTFDDVEPLDRQDAETGMRLETGSGFRRLIPAAGPTHGPALRSPWWTAPMPATMVR